MSDASQTVVPVYRIIANGGEVTKDASGEEQRVLFLTLLATPLKATATKDTFALSEWPSQMAGFLAPKAGLDGEIEARSLQMQIRRPRADGGYDEAVVAIRPRNAAAYADDAWNTVTKLWQNTLFPQVPGKQDQLWSDLADNITASLTGAKRTTEEQFGTPPTLSIDQLYDDGALIAPRPDANTIDVIVGALSVKQANFAVSEEAMRAARVAAKVFKGPAVVFDEAQEELDGSDTATITDTLPFRQNAFDRYRCLVLGNVIQTARDRSAALFDALKTVLNNGDADLTAVPAEDKPTVVPNQNQVIFEKTLENSRPKVEGVLPDHPSHDYYMWPQRPGNMAAKTSTGRATPVAPVADSNADQTKAEAEGIGHARAMFFAFQSDPTLARLFGLAVDCEVDEDDLRRAMARGGAAEGDWLLHLAPADIPHVTADNTIPVVATAAGLKAGGARHIRFWPASIFREPIYAAKTPSNVLDALVEQEDGVFLCGKDRLNGDKRYEITALDFRQSIEGKRGLQDRGQAMHSGGLAVLDRGRADQIVRDLALFDHAKGHLNKPDEWFVLHAEELTVGCKLDVALVGVASDSPPPQWRSLMQRYVDFEFGPDDATVEMLLRKLIPGLGQSKVLREETAHKQAARTIPIGEQSTNDSGKLERRRIEVIAEEGIFLWTGAPVAVDVNSGTSSMPSELPFTRKLDLPSASLGPQFRPPPLRYGMPYAFRMRAAFVGGGSPSAEEAEDTDPAATVMPASQTDRVIRPRRFLRHEGIRAPILLLPIHRALTRWGVMGHEHADQAIVRTVDTSGAPYVAKRDASGAADPKDMAREETERRAAEAEVGGIYLGLERRSQPKETMRIFVPPEVPQSILERHGTLDGGNAAAMMQGGLKDAVFTPQPKPKPSMESDEPSQEAAGFPIAVTVRIDALDSDGAIDRRDYFKASDQKGINRRSGIPVFEPGGHQPAKDGETGYLPDPAAKTYCLRARIRGSDVYLAGHLAVKIYQGTTYPDALPLAIVVQRKAGGQSRLRPTKIADIATKAGPAFLDSKGGFSTKKSKGSCQVQRVDFVLGVHDDYEIEVACLPEESVLARDFAITETVAVQLAAGGWISEFNEQDTLGLGIVPPTGSAYTGVAGKSVPRPDELNDVASMLVKAMTEYWPIEEIAAIRRLRVCHALNRPTGPVTWKKADDGSIAPLVSYRPAKMGDKAAIWEPLPGEKDNNGGVDALLSGTLEIDLAEIDGFDIIATTVGVDGQPLDDKQRGRSAISRRSGRWPRISKEDGDTSYAPVGSVYGFNVAADGRATLPRAQVTLMSVRNLPTHGASAPIKDEPESGLHLFVPDNESGRTAVELSPLFVAAFAGVTIEQNIALPEGADDKGHRRRLIKIERPHLFKDTLARRLDLSIAAISRHASDFETAPLYLDEKGTEQNLFRRQALVHGDQTVFSTEAVSVWINATRRPDACDARRPEPAFVIRRESKQLADASIKYTVTRRALSRIWLGRGWFSSGEGERLGIVLWPPGYETLNDLSLERNEVPIAGRDGDVALPDFQDGDLGEGGAYITRWGGDPTREDILPQRGFFIPPSAFAELDRAGAARVADNPHKPELASPVKMPVPRRADASKGEGDAKPVEYLEVALLTFEPCFDPDREEWFVDVDLRTKYAAEPFVRFGLVRYQKRAISEELKVSEPVSVMMQILPDRTITITRQQRPADAEMQQLDVRVHGPAGKAVKPIEITSDMGVTAQEWKKRSEALDRPHMKFTLFHEGMQNGFLTRVPVSQGFRDSVELDFAGTGNGELAGNLVWHKAISLPSAHLAAFGTGTLVAYVEEVDRRMPASYRPEPVTVETMLDENTFVDSGPRFAARVPLMEI